MYTQKTTPFLHQTRATDASRGKSGFAFLMEMGTGKTKVLIDEAGELFAGGVITGLLVIAPKSVCRTWIRELETHLGCAYEAVLWVSGAGKSLQAELKKVLNPDSGTLRVVIMNVEAFRAGTKALDYARKFVGSHRAEIAVDESQTIKNPSAKQTKNVVSLARDAVARRIATGTPAPNSPMDLYSQLEFIAPGSTGQRSYFGFRSRYAVLQEKNFGGRKVRIEVGYRNLEELQGIVSRHSFRVRKDECLDLPEKIYVTRDVELTTEQRRMYEQMRSEAMAEIGDSFSSSSAAITTLIRLQQIVCGYVRDDDGDLHHFDSHRIQAVLDICEQTDSDVIVWVGQHTPVIPILEAALEEKFGKGCVARFWGGNAGTRDAEAEAFMQNPSVRFMLSTQAAGGRGNTWINATTVVYFANTYNLEERMQSEDRCHRAGQGRHVTYHDLVAEDVAIDERLRKALVTKESISATLVGEEARQWL